MNFQPNFPFMKIKTPAPYVRMEYDAGQQVVSRFLDAVRESPDDAWAFVSKVYSARLDLNELRELLCADVGHVKIATYVNSQKNCLTRSMYVCDAGRKVRKLLHLHMIKEPDKNGKWKIFGVEQEECTRG